MLYWTFVMGAMAKRINVAARRQQEIKVVTNSSLDTKEIYGRQIAFELFATWAQVATIAGTDPLDRVCIGP